MLFQIFIALETSQLKKILSTHKVNWKKNCAIYSVFETLNNNVFMDGKLIIKIIKLFVQHQQL